MTIENNIKGIREKISGFAEKSGRKEEDVTLLAVTKTRTVEEINEAIRAGVTQIGENKVQEIMDKYQDVLETKWHMIGHLQRNKVKYIIDKVYMIHSVDSLNLAEEIDKRAGQKNLKMNVLIQVNTALEESKFGVGLEETGKLIEEVLEKCSNIKICGLMAIVPIAEDPEDVRVYFRKVKSLYDKYKDIKHESLDFKYLSMGMSHDFGVAILEGSNMVRVGTAIFGERKYS